MCINNWTRSTCCIRQSFVMEQRYLCSMTMELETIQQWLEKFSTSQKKDCSHITSFFACMIIKTCNQFHKSSGKCSLYPLPDVHKPLDRTHLLLVLVLPLLHHGAQAVVQHWQWLEIDQKFLPLYNFPEERLEQTSQAFAWIWKHEVHTISLINHFKTSSRL